MGLATQLSLLKAVIPDLGFWIERQTRVKGFDGSFYSLVPKAGEGRFLGTVISKPGSREAFQISDLVELAPFHKSSPIVILRVMGEVSLIEPDAALEWIRDSLLERLARYQRRWVEFREAESGEGAGRGVKEPAPLRIDGGSVSTQEEAAHLMQWISKEIDDIREAISGNT